MNSVKHLQPPTNNAIRMSVALTSKTHRLLDSYFGMSFRLLAPNSDLVSIEILESEKVPGRVVLFADGHQSSAPEIGGV